MLKKLAVMLLLAALPALVITGCKSNDSGSREFVPGQGWRPVK